MVNKTLNDISSIEEQIILFLVYRCGGLDALLADGCLLVGEIVQVALAVGGDDVLHLQCLRASERAVGSDVERHERAAVAFERLESL